MLRFWEKLFGKKKNKSEHELFLDFMRCAKEKMVSDTDKAMLKYLEEIYNFAVKSQKKIENKKTKVSAWISDDFGIDQQKIREEEAEKNKLPHPVELNIKT